MQIYRIEEVKPVLVLDLDGVICEETTRWDDWAERKPEPGILKTLERLCETYTLVVHTARSGREAFWITVRWFQLHGLVHYIEEIIFDKPIAVAYVDDKGYQSIEEVLENARDIAALGL